MRWIGFKQQWILVLNTTFFNSHFINTTHIQRYLAINPVSFRFLIFLFFTSIIQATVSNLMRAMAEVCTRDLFLLLPGGMMFTWLALLVLKFATMLLESTAFMLRLLLLLLLLFMLLFTFRTSVRIPAENAAKSTALDPLMIEVLWALVQDWTLGLWYMKGRSLLTTCFCLFLSFGWIGSESFSLVDRLTLQINMYLNVKINGMYVWKSESRPCHLIIAVQL